MRIIIFILYLFPFTLGFVFSQNKHKTQQSSFFLTDDLPYQINISDSGEIFVAGRAPAITSDDCYLAKHNGNGNFAWGKIIGGTGYDYFQKIGFVENNIICGGNTNSFGNQQSFMIVKFAPNGDTVFSRILGGKNYDKLLEIAPSGNNFLIGGYSNSFGSVNNNDLLLMYVDSMANPLWVKNYEGSGEETVHRVIQAGTDFVLAGNTTSFGAGLKDVFAMKTDSAGNIKWLKCFGATDDEDAIDMVIANENIYLCGYTKSVSGWQDLWLMKLDSSGNLLWNMAVDFGLNEKGNKIFYRNGKIFVCGYLQTYTGTYDDIFVLRTDENGENISTKIFPHAGFEYGNFIAEISEKILVAGLQSDSDKIKIFETDDSLFSCNSSSYDFNTTSVPVLITDTVFTVKSVPPDSVIQANGGNFADYGNALVNVDVCLLPSDTTVVSEFSHPFSMFHFFPNPNDGKFNVKMSEYGNLKMSKVEIYNLHWEKVYSSVLTINSSASFTVSHQLLTISANLPNGIYFLQMSCENFSFTEKMVVQKR